MLIRLNWVQNAQTLPEIHLFSDDSQTGKLISHRIYEGIRQINTANFADELFLYRRCLRKFVRGLSLFQGTSSRRLNNIQTGQTEVVTNYFKARLEPRRRPQNKNKNNLINNGSRR